MVDENYKYLNIDICWLEIVVVVCVFILEKGFEGLRICEIVVCVGINILMLYYYVLIKKVLVELVVDVL